MKNSNNFLLHFSFCWLKLFHDSNKYQLFRKSFSAGPVSQKDAKTYSLDSLKTCETYCFEMLPGKVFLLLKGSESLYPHSFQTLDSAEFRNENWGMKVREETRRKKKKNNGSDKMKILFGFQQEKIFLSTFQNFDLKLKNKIWSFCQLFLFVYQVKIHSTGFSINNILCDITESAEYKRYEVNAILTKKNIRNKSYSYTFNPHVCLFKMEMLFTKW